VKCAVFNVTTVGMLTETVLAAVLVTIQEDIVKSAPRHVRMEGSLTQTSASATAQPQTT
jgi:hypothetical protein